MNSKNNSCILLFALLCISFLGASAKSEKCITMSAFNKKAATDSMAFVRMDQSELQIKQWIANHAQVLHTQQVITIPVVVHVIWNDPIENISSAQIQSQIDILNEDFRLMNADSLTPSDPFWAYTADAQIEFCLASRAPSGSATSGITRTFTNTVSFAGAGDGSEKFTSSGGCDNWDPTRYLNLWVCNLDVSGGTLGYASFPSDLATNPNEDGVVIRYQAFGDIGTVAAPNDLGRTASHEVGHWLNLRHIWGDDTCGDDLVADTEPAEQANYGCPSFPFNSNSACGSGVNGEMFMNYMDYVDDYCMNMFTSGQAMRMNATLNGDRIGLRTSLGCGSPANVSDILLDTDFDIYPNPSNGNFSIKNDNSESQILDICIYDILGSKIWESQSVNSSPLKVELGQVTNGVYIVAITSKGSSVMRKIIISK